MRHRYLEERVGVRVFQYYLGDFKMKNNVARKLTCCVCGHKMEARVFELGGSINEGVFYMQCEYPSCRFNGSSISLIMRMSGLGQRETTDILKLFVAKSDDEVITKNIKKIISRRTRLPGGTFHPK